MASRVQSGAAGAIPCLAAALLLSLMCAQVAAQVSPDVPISSGQTLEGTLESTDAAALPPDSRSCDEYHRDGYVFSSDVAKQIVIDLHCDFDGYLFLVGPDDTILATNDDYFTTARSQIVFTSIQSGDYRIVVSSFSAGMTGSYSLSLDLTDAPPPSEDVEITVGDVVSGELTVDDNAYLPGTDRGTSDFFRDGYVFNGIAGVRVRIEINAQFDGFLFLLDPNGVIIAFNDDYRSVNRSLIQQTLAISGPHRIVVSTFSQMRTGGYILSLTAEGHPTGLTLH